MSLTQKKITTKFDNEKGAAILGRPNKLHKEVGSGCLVGGLKLPAWWPHFLEHQGELDLGVVELLGALSLA